MGFKINQYNRCVANKVINGKQCTIAWYVDDVKISHMDQSVIDDIINNLKKMVWGPKSHKWKGTRLTRYDNNS